LKEAKEIGVKVSFTKMGIEVLVITSNVATPTTSTRSRDSFGANESLG